MPDDEVRGAGGGGAKKAAGTSTILLVEDNKAVADAVEETLEHQGWKVVGCDDGRTAQRKISGGARYDLPMIDDELPGVKGADLARYVRKLPRRRTPIIVFSASDCEREAWRAGADAFLKKPEGMGALVSTVRRRLRGWDA